MQTAVILNPKSTRDGETRLQKDAHVTECCIFMITVKGATPSSLKARPGVHRTVSIVVLVLRTVYRITYSKTDKTSGAIEDPPETKRREWRRPCVGSGCMKLTTVVVVESSYTRAENNTMVSRAAEVIVVMQWKSVKREDIEQAGFSRQD